MNEQRMDDKAWRRATDDPGAHGQDRGDARRGSARDAGGGRAGGSPGEGRDDGLGGSRAGGRSGRESGGYAGGRYGAGGYAGDPQMGDYYAGDGRSGSARRDDRFDYGGSRRDEDSRSSSYGGLGDRGGYGTHGWSRQGSGHDLDDRQFDPDYRQWREQQMREFDRDYELWRQERYSKFSEEFNQWRASRQRAAGDPDAGAASPDGRSATSTPKTG